MRPSLYEKLSPHQQERLKTFGQMLREINRSINLVSRADEDHLFERHIHHALCLTIRRFPEGSTVIDWGTGGGLPAIPLAIALPDVSIIAVDSVDKKIRAVRAMARRLELTNLKAWSGRAETFTGCSPYSISRATTTLAELWSWHDRVRASLSDVPPEECWRPGLICLKGGDLGDEIATLPGDVRVRTYPLEDVIEGSYYTEKYVVECFTAAEPPPDEHRS